jgi:predicted MPP superfamily phosphohydrolase
MDQISWLHLSDLHMNGFRVEYDRKQIMESLKEDLARLARTEPRPDFIFFTGDLVFGHMPDESIDKQFDMGFQLLEQIRTIWTLEIPKENIFLVPGNHDVRRDFATPAITQFLNSVTDPKILAALLKRPDKQWEQVIERLKPYRDALIRHGYDHLLQNPESLAYAQVKIIGSWNIQICGLNTAWSCARDKEKGRLWVCGKWQISEVTKGLKSQISICLMHHPTSWFREEEDTSTLERLIESNFMFLLHGHEHDEWVVSSDSHVRIAAAALYEDEDAKNGYNLTSFEPASGEVIVRLRRYDKKGRMWIQNIVGNKTDDKGKWAIRGLGRQQSVAASGTQTISAALASASNKIWDIFLAVPMAALLPNEYQRQRRDIKKVVLTLRQRWGGFKIYYPAEDIPVSAKWDPPDMAMVRGLKAISSCRIFIMIYSVDKPSSILVEAGFALANGIPSIYFVKSGLKLPFLLNAASQAASDVKVYEYEHYSDIVRILKKYKEEFIEFMRKSKQSISPSHRTTSTTA